MQVNHWDRLGIASPSIRSAQGAGSRRMYSADDLAAVAIVGRLRSMNIGLKCLRLAMRRIRELWPVLTDAPSDAMVVICHDGTCRRLADGANLRELLYGDSVGMVLDVGRSVAAARTRMRTETPAPATTPTGERPHASTWGEDW